MPGRLHLQCDRNDLAQYLGAPLPPGGPEVPNLDMKPGQDVWTLDESRSPVPMRWGMILQGQSKGRRHPLMETVVNARSETVFEKPAFGGVQRALVPCHGWYEWTGEQRKKTRWRFSTADGALVMFAAIYSVWNGPGGVRLHQCATLTREPNDLVRPIHHRMGFILPETEWDNWLSGEMVPLETAPDGLLIVEEAKRMGQ